MRRLALLGLVVLIASDVDARDRRCGHLRADRTGDCDPGYAFFEAFPSSGAGTSGPCSTTPPTGAKGEVLTFTRASSGTCTKTASGGLATTGIADGDLVTLSSNVARVEYDSAGTLGLLVESARTNSALRSEEIDNASWLKLNNVVAAPTVTANQAVSPDGVTTADSVAYPQVIGASAQSSVAQQVTMTAVPWTCSGYVKGASTSGRTYISGTVSGASFPMSGACDFVSASWRRCVVTATMTAATYYVQYGGDLRDGAQVTQPAQTVYWWGMQCEAGAYATSYIPTTSAAVTRAADLGSFPVTASTPASGCLAATAETQTGALGTNRGWVSLGTGATWKTGLAGSPTSASALSLVNGASGVVTRAVTAGRRRLGMYWGATGVGVSVDGALTTGAGVAGTASLSQVNLLNYDASASTGQDGIISRVVYEPNSTTRCTQ